MDSPKSRKLDDWNKLFEFYKLVCDREQAYLNRFETRSRFYLTAVLALLGAAVIGLSRIDVSSAEPWQFTVIVPVILLLLLIPVITERAIDATFRVYRRSVWEAISRAKVEAELGLCDPLPDSVSPRRLVFWPEEPLITVRNLDGYTEADELPTAPVNGSSAPALAHGQQHFFKKGLGLLVWYFTVSMKARQYPPPPGALPSYRSYGARREREGIFIIYLRTFRAVKALSLAVLAVTVVLTVWLLGSAAGVWPGSPEGTSQPAHAERDLSKPASDAIVLTKEAPTGRSTSSTEVTSPGHGERDLSNQESRQLVQPDGDARRRLAEVIEEIPPPGNGGGWAPSATGANPQSLSDLYTDGHYNTWVSGGLSVALQDSYPEVRAMALKTLMDAVAWPLKPYRGAVASWDQQALLMTPIPPLQPADVSALHADVADLLDSEHHIIQNFAARVLVAFGDAAAGHHTALETLAGDETADVVGRLAAIHALAKLDHDVLSHRQLIEANLASSDRIKNKHAAGATGNSAPLLAALAESLRASVEASWATMAESGAEASWNWRQGPVRDYDFERAERRAEVGVHLLAAEIPHLEFTSWLKSFENRVLSMDSGDATEGTLRARRRWLDRHGNYQDIRLRALSKHTASEDVAFGMLLPEALSEPATPGLLSALAMASWARLYDSGKPFDVDLAAHVGSLTDALDGTDRESKAGPSDEKLSEARASCIILAVLRVDPAERARVYMRILDGSAPVSLRMVALATLVASTPRELLPVTRLVQFADDAPPWVTQSWGYSLGSLGRIPDELVAPLVEELIAPVPQSERPGGRGQRHLEIGRMLGEIETSAAIRARLEPVLAPKFDSDQAFFLARLAAVRYVTRSETDHGPSAVLNRFLARSVDIGHIDLCVRALQIRALQGRFGPADEQTLRSIITDVPDELVNPTSYTRTENFRISAGGGEGGSFATWRSTFSTASSGPLPTVDLLAILAPTRNLSYLAISRYWAHLLGGGKPEARYLLSVAGRPMGDPDYSGLSAQQRVATLVSCTAREDLTLELQKEIRTEIGSQVIGNSWGNDQLELLRNARDQLVEGTTQRVAVDGVIESIQEKRIWRTTTIWIAIAFLVHAVIWGMLLWWYPKSPKVQSLFFWNPFIRKIFGLGYVHVVLLFVPVLRSRLLAPFAEAFVEDAKIGEFSKEEASRYYEGQRVAEGSEELDLAGTIEDLLGHRIVLCGESGAGKTQFLRHLLWCRRGGRRPIAFLRAKDCGQGVSEALGAKLEGPAKDPAFLESLIHNRAIDICVDGLNEVSPLIEEKIVGFFKKRRRASFILTTQQSDTEYPPTFEIVELLGLSTDRALDFLKKQADKGDSERDRVEFDRRCDRFIQDVFPGDLTESEFERRMAVISNPLDLVEIAGMIQEGRVPDINRLRDQQLGALQESYRDRNKREFPLARFCSAVASLTRAQTESIDVAAFGLELQALKDRRLVVRRTTSLDDKAEYWWFRHDKIRDYFVGLHLAEELDLEDMASTKTLLDDKTLIGSFRALAWALPLPTALQLRDRTCEIAAATRDHTLSDAIVEIVRLRLRTERMAA